MKSLLQTFSYFMFTYTCIFKGIISTVKLGFKSKDIWRKKPAITSTFSANPTTAKFLQGTFKKLKTCSFSIKLIQTRNIPSYSMLQRPQKIMKRHLLGLPSLLVKCRLQVCYCLPSTGPWDSPHFIRTKCLLTCFHS